MSQQTREDKKEATKLRSCKLCGSEISPYSPFCRNCGHPQGSMLALWVMVAILILMVVIYVGMSIFCLCNVDRFRVYTESYPEVKEERGESWPGRNTPERTD